MRRKWMLALLSVIMLFGVVPAYGAEASRNSLVWYGYNDDGKLVGINVTTFTGNKSTTKSIFPKEVSNLKLVGEWIYFLVVDERDEWTYQIAKIKKDGSAFTYVNKDADFASFDVLGNMIYFVKKEKREDMPDVLSFGSMRIDGTSEQTILSKSPFYSFEINNGYIYYTNRDNDKFYRMKTDGTGAKALSSKGVSTYEFFGDVLFFSEMVDGGYSYLGVFADQNGSRKKTFASYPYIDPIAYVNNKLFYRSNMVDKNGYNKSDMYVYNRYTGKKNKLLSLDANDRFLGKVGDDLAFLSFKKGTVYKVGYDGKVKK
ncbi:DUF5050 domain-containing protein [Paenibacillus pabuli]|uniref:DUF5050 domain-containing protein n=1 Tax=Paenibacillus pabuli TaxID=1472 RepID=UPI00078513C2|nr:DUF5050 domain-containing protein [Paenibacillus pabuli]MEC0124432.1 DUF5050 domain-containing protein [Paenibacillus pabuli]